MPLRRASNPASGRLLRGTASQGERPTAPPTAPIRTASDASAACKVSSVKRLAGRIDARAAERPLVDDQVVGQPLGHPRDLGGDLRSDEVAGKQKQLGHQIGRSAATS